MKHETHILIGPFMSSSDIYVSSKKRRRAHHIWGFHRELFGVLLFTTPLFSTNNTRTLCLLLTNPAVTGPRWYPRHHTLLTTPGRCTCLSLPAQRSERALHSKTNERLELRQQITAIHSVPICRAHFHTSSFVAAGASATNSNPTTVALTTYKTQTYSHKPNRAGIGRAQRTQWARQYRIRY
jgi:hypothetical protein